MFLIGLLVAVLVCSFLPGSMYDTTWKAMVNIIADDEIFSLKDYSYNELKYTLTYDQSEVLSHVLVILGIGLAIAIVLTIVLKALTKKKK